VIPQASRMNTSCHTSETDEMAKSNRKQFNRRDVLRAVGAGATMLVLPRRLMGQQIAGQKSHLVTIGFDDGFRKSSIRTAEIYEKYRLSACFNVIATADRPDFVLPNEYHRWPVGNFGLWNELQDRGHEIMPHGYRHADLSQVQLSEAKQLILQCLDVFSKKLNGFDPKKAVFNFPYNASTPEIEAWLVGQVKAFRTSGPAVNPLPHRGQSKLTCTSSGPDNIDAHLNGEVDKLLAQPAGWLIYNAHGLDAEGWGPLSASALDKLLARLVEIPSVGILPAGKALSAV
jgi:peptidoglycan/xylan/chitin deacetylase (PgdA/CDA1 family)